MTEDRPHVTVLLDEIADHMAPADGEIFVDCTLGWGGHAEALLERADCRVIGIDRDPAALAAARERLARFGDRFVAVQGSFADLSQVLDQLGLTRVHGIYADLGVSSPQLDTADRGFSFRLPGPIDMRMDPSASTSAADIVGTWTEDDLTTLIGTYGEERYARRIARTIVAGRPWNDTVQLAEAIADAVPGRPPQRIHPATRTFQAVRIRVNDELGQLERLLPAAVQALHPGGRLAIISFHSLEDRIVKRFLASESGHTGPKDAYGNPMTKPTVEGPRKAVKSSPHDPNPRARSARLRIATRLP